MVNINFINLRRDRHTYMHQITHTHTHCERRLHGNMQKMLHLWGSAFHAPCVWASEHPAWAIYSSPTGSPSSLGGTSSVGDWDWRQSPTGKATVTASHMRGCSLPTHEEVFCVLLHFRHESSYSSRVKLSLGNAWQGRKSGTLCVFTLVCNQKHLGAWVAWLIHCNQWPPLISRYLRKLKIYIGTFSVYTHWLLLRLKKICFKVANNLFHMLLSLLYV